MIASQAVFEARLPPLSGRWVSVYRAVWCLLAVAAVAFLAASILYPTAHPAVLALRLLKGAIVISVSAILIRRRANDPVAALLSLAFVTWTITSSFDFASADALPMLLDRVRFLLFVLALLLFPDGSWRPAWTRSIALASAGVFVLGLAEGIGIAPTRVFLPLAIACVIAALASLILRFRTAESEAVRQQLKWVALGLVSGIGLILSARAGAALAAVSPRLEPLPVVWEAMFQLGIVIVALGFLVSLLRYRLFDAETVISRSAAYAALTIAVVATFGGTEALIQNLGQSYLGMNVGGVSGGMAAAVAALLLNPLHYHITSWAEDRFQPDLARLKREMPELLARLGTSTSTRRVCDRVLPRINIAIHATRSALLLDGRIVGAYGITRREAREWADRSFGENPRWTNRDESDQVFPLRLPLGNATSAAAWLVLGPRPDGTLYGREDLDAVRSTLPSLHNALIATKARQILDAAIDRREKHLRTEIRKIYERLTELEGSRT